MGVCLISKFINFNLSNRCSFLTFFGPFLANIGYSYDQNSINFAPLSNKVPFFKNYEFNFSWYSTEVLATIWPVFGEFFLRIGNWKKRVILFLAGFEHQPTCFTTESPLQLIKNCVKRSININTFWNFLINSTKFLLNFFMFHLGGRK